MGVAGGGEVAGRGEDARGGVVELGARQSATVGPPVMSTVPSVSRVAVWWVRAASRPPAKLKVPLAGL